MKGWKKAASRQFLLNARQIGFLIMQRSLISVLLKIGRNFKNGLKNVSVSTNRLH